MNRLKVGVLFGGVSEEHPISVKSAQEVAANLDPERYEPYYIGISKSGEWKLCDGPGPAWEGGTCRPVAWAPGRGVHRLLVDEPAGESIRLDVVFPVLHGRYGEDGSVQGLLELLGVPYVGCDVPSSALCMDKSLTYLVARSVDVATPDFRVIGPGANIDPGAFGYPAFVKPARSGSSFGVTKVLRGGELPAAVRVARHYDAKILVEEAVAGREIGCAVLGDGTDLIVGEPDQITLSHGFFRIHQEDAPEQGSENALITVPAAIPAESRALVQQTARTLYRALGCRGLARVDLFLREDGGVLLNEVNTLPGLTSYSRYPRMMEAAGLSRADVIDRVLALALAGHADAR